MKIKIFPLLLLSSFFALPTCLHPAFQDTGWGARAGGMGNCFTAIANDSSAPLWNPAGIAQLKTIGTTFLYNKLFAGLEGVNISQMFGSLVYPLESGAIGFTVTDFSLLGYYRENTFAASYAYNLIEPLKLKFPLIVGGSLKYMTHGYTLDSRTQSTNDPVFAKTSAGGFTPDIGILVKPGRLSVGVSMLNVFQPDVGLKSEDKVPSVLKCGAAFKLGNFSWFERITPVAELTYRKPAGSDADVKLAGGIELWLKNIIALRAGGNDREITAGFSYLRSFGESGVQLDYAFSAPLQLSGTSGSHRVEFTLKMPVMQSGRRIDDKTAKIVTEKQTSIGESQDIQRERFAKQGYQYFDRGDYKEAIAAWEKVLKIDPDDSEIRGKIRLATMWLGQESSSTQPAQPEVQGQQKDKLDINTANEIELIDIGFTREQARNIVAYRKKTKFKKIEDVINVPGITMEKYKEVKNSIKAGGK
jgi:DNA uptake protein ComE-like DNA-binding protein